jgi:hypothetical protein
MVKSSSCGGPEVRTWLPPPPLHDQATESDGGGEGGSDSGPDTLPAAPRPAPPLRAQMQGEGGIEPGLAGVSVVSTWPW